MSFLTAIIYGVIQGLSEFLPVSSSGHLALLPYFMAFQDPGVLFDLCLHLGTAGAVLWYFRERILGLLSVLGPAIIDFRVQNDRLNFLRNFILATGASVVSILLLKPLSAYGRGPWMIMLNQVVFGLVLWMADIYQRKQTHVEAGYFERALRWKVAVFIGVAQAIAIFPGVSRSGITLSAAFFMGIDRSQAGAFSFLLSLPIIIAGVLVEIPDIALAAKAGQFDLTVLCVGVVTSFVVGLITIHFFMKLIARIQLVWFTGYRLALAGVLLYFLTR